MPYNITPPLPSERSFGIVMGCFFAILAFFFSEKFLVFSLISIVFFITAIFFSTLLRPFNILWYKLGLLLHKLINPIILFLMYSLVFIPVGMLLKLFRKDILKLSQKVDSNWVDTQDRDPFEFEQQF